MTATASTNARISNEAVQSLLHFADVLGIIRDANAQRKMTRAQRIKRWFSFRITKIRETVRFYKNY